MTLDPGPPRRNPSGGLGGAAPQWVRVLGSRPPPGSGSARITRNYPSRVQEGIWVWVWDWVLGLGNISRRPKIQKNQISNISRILENVSDLRVHFILK